jgi:preprotein translocase subunit YajC
VDTTALIIWAVFAVAMYAFLILPKKRQQQKQDAMLGALDEGDEVLLNSGIYGFISAIDDSILWVEVAENVELKVARSSISGRVMKSTGTDEEDENE